jgi:hypothetical protein
MVPREANAALIAAAPETAAERDRLEISCSDLILERDRLRATVAELVNQLAIAESWLDEYTPKIHIESIHAAIINRAKNGDENGE